MGSRLGRPNRTGPEHPDPLIRGLVRVRIERGLTKRELGKRMGLSMTAVAALESDRPPSNPTLATMRRWMDALGVEDIDLRFKETP